MKTAPKIALKDSPIWMLLLVFAYSIRANNFSMIQKQDSPLIEAKIFIIVTTLICNPRIMMLEQKKESDKGSLMKYPCFPLT